MLLNYIFKRILLMVPTLFGIMLINFIIIQAAPGGPVQQILSKMRGQGSDIDMRFGGGDDMLGGATAGFGEDHSSAYKGAHGIDPAFIKDLEKQFGFDKPAHERFVLMIKNYLTFDFGKSYFRNKSVVSLVKEKLAVSISLGVFPKR